VVHEGAVVPGAGCQSLPEIRSNRRVPTHETALYERVVVDPRLSEVTPERLVLRVDCANR